MYACSFLHNYLCRCEHCLLYDYNSLLIEGQIPFSFIFGTLYDTHMTFNFLKLHVCGIRNQKAKINKRKVL